jgi:hypothetical protein
MYTTDDVDEQAKQDEKKTIALLIMAELTSGQVEDLIEILAMTDPKSERYLTPHDEYYALINNAYAIPEIGRILTQPEINEVVGLLDEKYECNWGEEHLQEVLQEWKKTL